MELFTPEIGLVIWMFVAFAILFFILWKWGWPVVLKMIDDRADLIDKGVEYAQNAKDQLDNARQEAQKYLDEARRQQADILRDADRMKTQIIEEARTAASAEAQKVMDAARLAIQQEQKEAGLRFKEQVSEFALQIATKVVRNDMADDKAQKALVDNLLNEIENKN